MNTPRIYCYYERDFRLQVAEDIGNIVGWSKSWDTACPDWNTSVLGSYTAAQHPLWDAMRKRLLERGATEDMRHRYYRWLAIDFSLKQCGHSAYFAHSDLLWGGFHHRPMELERSLVCYDNASDCLIFGLSKMYRAFVAVLMDALSNPVVPHPWSVLLGWHGVYIHTEPGLISRSGPSLLIHKQINHP